MDFCILQLLQKGRTHELETLGVGCNHRLDNDNAILYLV